MHSYDMFMISCVNFRFVLGSTFGALGGQKVIKMSSKVDAKIGIEKGRLRGGPIAKEILQLQGKRGVRGQVDLPRGGEKVRKKGRNEERKKQRKEERNIRRFEERRGVLHALTRRVGRLEQVVWGR